MAPTFSELLLFTTSCEFVGIDIPIGLPRVAVQGGRPCNREARDLLRPTRHGSVFSAPPRQVLQARTFEEANELHRDHSNGDIGLSRQVFGVLPRIAEVDDLMTPRLQRRIFESHPELSYRELNEGSPLPYGKTTAAGVLFRMRLLRKAGLSEGLDHHAQGLGNAGMDDLLDAAAVAWTAVRFGDNGATRVPETPEKDARGLRMEIWR